MPTHMGAFAEAAARFEGIDPADWPAVRTFFTQTLPALPAPRRQAIVDFLLAQDGAATRYGVVVEFDPATWWGTIRSATQLLSFHGTQVHRMTPMMSLRAGDRVRFLLTAADQPRILKVFRGVDP